MNSVALNEAIHVLLREVTDKAILPRYRKLAAHEITAKAADDVVTVADHESEAMLEEGLARIADLPVVGEEASFADASVQERLSGELAQLSHRIAYSKITVRLEAREVEPVRDVAVRLPFPWLESLGLEHLLTAARGGRSVSNA